MPNDNLPPPAFRTMTEQQRKELAREIGAGVLRAQKQFDHLPPSEVVPEILAALLSLAAEIAFTNAKMSAYKFNQACDQAIKDRWRIV